MPRRRTILGFACVILAGIQGSGCGSSSTATPPPPPGVHFVQTANSTTASSGPPQSYTATFAGAVTPGNTIVMIFWWMHDKSVTNGISGVSDSEGNTYQLGLDVTALINSGTDAEILYYYAQNVKGNTPATVTIGTTAQAYTSQVSMVITEYSGVSSVDVTNVVSLPPAGTTESTGTSTTHSAPEVVLGSLLITYTTPIGPGTGFTSRFNSDYFLVEDKIVSTAGSYDAEFSMPPPYPQYLIAIPSMITLR